MRYDIQNNLEKILEREIGNFASIAIKIEKRRLGLVNQQIPNELKSEFIKGVLFICKNELGLPVDNLTKQKLISMVDKGKDNEGSLFKIFNSNYSPVF